MNKTNFSDLQGFLPPFLASPHFSRNPPHCILYTPLISMAHPIPWHIHFWYIYALHFWYISMLHTAHPACSHCILDTLHPGGGLSSRISLPLPDSDCCLITIGEYNQQSSQHHCLFPLGFACRTASELVVASVHMQV